MADICIDFDSCDLNPIDMGWKAYNLSVMYQSRSFQIPFGFVLSTNIYDEKIKDEIKKSLMQVIEKKVNEDSYLNERVNNYLKTTNIEDISHISFRKLFDLILWLEEKHSYPQDEITSEASRKLKRKFKDQLGTWYMILTCINSELKNLQSNAIYIRSSSNIKESILWGKGGAFITKLHAKSHLTNEELLYDDIIEIYLSVLEPISITLFKSHPSKEFSMAILFQEKKEPFISGRGWCEVISEETDKAKIKIDIQIREGEDIPSLETMPEQYTYINEYKKNDNLRFHKIIEKRPEKGVGKQTYKYKFDLDGDEMVTLPATIKSKKLNEDVQKTLCDFMVTNIFNFWRKKKSSLSKQKIEFLLSLSLKEMVIVQCDNYTER